MREISISPGTSEPLAIPERMREDFADFFEKYSPALRHTTLHLPDFTDPDWSRQDEPFDPFAEHPERCVRGKQVVVPYYTWKSAVVARYAIHELVYWADVNRYNIGVEVGPSSSLTPLAWAGSHKRTIMLAFDDYRRPLHSYPSDAPLSSYSQYPIMARLISGMNFESSAAFFFPFAVEWEHVREALAGMANHIHIVAPQYEPRKFMSLLKASSSLVAPGGDLIVVGDGDMGDLKADLMYEYFIRGHIANGYAKKDFSTVREILPQCSVYSFDALTIGQVFHIWGSRYMQYWEDDNGELRSPSGKLGVALFTGKT